MKLSYSNANVKQPGTCLGMLQHFPTYNELKLKNAKTISGSFSGAFFHYISTINFVME
jgi:hypothetical protein